MSGTWPAGIPHALAASRRGRVTVLGGDERPRAWGGEMLADARRVAGGLTRAGVRPGERVLLVLPTNGGFLDAFFGAAVYGAIPCQLSPPEGIGVMSAFLARLDDLVASVGARAVITTPDLAPRLSERHPQDGGSGLLVLTPEALAEGPALEGLPDTDPDRPAFLQFTSGTTHLPKAATISQGAVAANTRQIAAATTMGPGDVVVSWLPMFHDMGLVGMLTGLFSDADCVLSTPFSFLRRPASWLQTLSRFGGTHSPAPAFSYRYVLDRARPSDLEGLDLSRWRTAFIGAEPIQADAVRAFTERLAPLGMRASTMLPCYGMAEATLAVTFCVGGLRTLQLSRRALAERGLVAAPADGDARDALEVVCCGPALPGTEVRVVGADGAALADGCLGEVVVRGPTLFRGYWEAGASAPPARSAEGRDELRTGDLGFLVEGELYVTGRKKDTIIIRGHNHHPEEVEWAAARVPGVRAGRVVAVGLPDPELGTERLCVLAEVDRRAGVDPLDLETALRRRVHEESGLAVDRVELVAAGAIPVTTSGKVRRSQARALLERAVAERGRPERATPGRGGASHRTEASNPGDVADVAGGGPR